MALSKEQIKDNYPLSVYNYRVTFLLEGESVSVGFSEVSGLTLEYEPVTYKHGLSFMTGAKIIPGMRQPVKLTLKRGLVAKVDFLLNWLQETSINPSGATTKRDVLVDLCDETGTAMVRWKAQAALPVKLEAPTFAANSNDVAIESLELIAHGLQIEHNPL